MTKENDIKSTRMHQCPFEIIDGEKPRRDRVACLVDEEAAHVIARVLRAGAGPLTFHRVSDKDVCFGCDGVLITKDGTREITDIAMIMENVGSDETKIDWSMIWTKVAKQAADHLRLDDVKEGRKK